METHSSILARRIPQTEEPGGLQSMGAAELDMTGPTEHKQEMAKVNIYVLGISELKWMGMGDFNSDDHFICYCGQESLRRTGRALRVNNRV